MVNDFLRPSSTHQLCGGGGCMVAISVIFLTSFFFFNSSDSCDTRARFPTFPLAAVAVTFFSKSKKYQPASTPCVRPYQASTHQGAGACITPSTSLSGPQISCPWQ